jgi:hypothetical protein
MNIPAVIRSPDRTWRLNRLFSFVDMNMISNAWLQLHYIADCNFVKENLGKRRVFLITEIQLKDYGDDTETMIGALSSLVALFALITLFAPKFAIRNIKKCHV